jgi:hypothetical protein
METCAICLDSFAISENNTVKLRCGHSFHFSCCLRNLNHNSACPLCRENILGEQYVDNIPNVFGDAYEDNVHDQNVVNVDNSIYNIAEQLGLYVQIEGLLHQAANNDIRNNPDSLEYSRRNIYDLCMRFSSELIRINNRYRDRDRREVLVYNQRDNRNGVLYPIRGVIMYNDVVYIDAPVYNING